MPSSSFTLNAWVTGGRHRHHRQRDHFGAESALYVAIQSPIGRWPAGTPIQYVIADLYERNVNRETTSLKLASFTIDAYALGSGGTVETTAGTFRAILRIDAIVKKSRSTSFLIDAWVTKGGSFTIDAYVRPGGTFTISAFVV